MLASKQTISEDGEEEMKNERSTWELLADFRGDVMLWLLIALVAWLLHSVPSAGLSFKEIFTAMKVELPTQTAWVMLVCETYDKWRLICEPLALLAFAAWFFLPLWVGKIALRYVEAEPRVYAKFQVSVTMVLSLILAFSFYLLLASFKALAGPMLSLINAS